MADLLSELRRRGVCFAKVGDTMDGLDDPEPLRTNGMTVIDKHTFVLGLGQDDDTLMKNMHRHARNRIRKTEKEGVHTLEAASADDVDEYWRLSKVTADRIREKGTILEMPREFFVKVFHNMIETDKARLFLAKRDDDLLAGVLCFGCGDTMLAYHAASTRDRQLTGLHGPTACFWRAIRTSREMGLTTFDLGGVTPNLPKTDSRRGVYRFKREWGGELKTFYNGEKAFSRIGYQFQEKILLPVWKTAHPLLLRAGRLAGGPRHHD